MRWYHLLQLALLSVLAAHCAVSGYRHSSTKSLRADVRRLAAENGAAVSPTGQPLYLVVDEAGVVTAGAAASTAASTTASTAAVRRATPDLSNIATTLKVDVALRLLTVAVLLLMHTLFVLRYLCGFFFSTRILHTVIAKNARMFLLAVFILVVAVVMFAALYAARFGVVDPSLRGDGWFFYVVLGLRYQRFFEVCLRLTGAV